MTTAMMHISQGCINKAKLIVTGNTRLQAIERMRHALKHFVVSGVDTTIPFLSAVMQRTDFVTGHIDTRWLQEVVCAPGESRT